MYLKLTTVFYIDHKYNITFMSYRLAALLNKRKWKCIYMCL